MTLNEATTQSSWTIQSNTRLLNGYLVAMGAVGALLIYLTRGRVQESLKDLQGYWAGILLVSIALGGYLFFEDTLIRVDHSIRGLVILKTGRFTKRSYVVPFDQVAAVLVTSIGKSYRGIVTHHLVLKLKNGKREAPGRLSTDQSEIIEVAQRLANDIGCECVVGRKYYPLNASRFVLSALGAILIYAVWYRATTGQWCRAMWYGSAPPIIMAFSFFSLLRISRRL